MNSNNICQFYKHYKDISKQLLDSIEVGNMIKVNDWEVPMKVIGVSDNYFLMVEEDGDYYSVCEKKPCEINYNNMVKGMYHTGSDNWVFGSPVWDKEFGEKDTIENYLYEFEEGVCELSVRTSRPIYDLYVR